MQGLAYENLIKKSDAYKVLCRDLLHNSACHSYMIVSQDGIANYTLAKLLSCEIVGGNDEKEIKIAKQDKHPDIKEIPSRENQSSKSTITVSDIDELKKDLYITPLRSEKKVYLINGGHLLNPQSQNKLLKTLEEPPNNVHFIITATETHSILPTVVSRCKKIEIAPFSYSDLVEALSGSADMDKVAKAVSSSRGLLESAVAFLTNKKLSNLFDITIDIAKNTASSKDILTASSQMIAFKDNISDMVDYLNIIFRDVYVTLCDKKELVLLKPYQSQIDEIAKMYSLTAIENIMPVFARTKERIKMSGNTNSIVDELLFSMMEKKAKLEKS